MSIRTLGLVLSMTSLSAYAIPSLQSCGVPNAIANNMYFDETCSTAYVGLPDIGQVKVDSLYRANSNFCDNYHSSMDGYSGIAEAMQRVNQERNKLARQSVELEQNFADLRLTLNSKKALIPLAMRELAEEQAEYEVLESQLSSAQQILHSCLDIASEEDCTIERQSFVTLSSEKNALRRQISRIQSRVGYLNRQVDLVENRIADLNISIQRNSDQISQMALEVDDYFSTIEQRLLKYTETFGGTAKLLFKVDQSSYLAEKRANAEDVLASMQWRSIDPKRSEIQFVANFQSPDINDIQRMMLPVMSITTPQFERYGTATVNIDKSEPEPKSIDQLTSSSIVQYRESHSAFPAAFNSQINLNLHGACLINSDNKQQLASYVAPFLSYSYEIQGRAGYRAKVHQRAMIEFLKKSKGGRFMSFSYVKTKIRERQEYDTLVEITLTSDSKKGEEITKRFKREIAINVLERAAVAILDSIATRRMPSFAFDPQTSADDNRNLSHHIATLGSGLNMTSMMCSSAGSFACSLGWDLDSFSFGRRGLHYIGTVGATYEEQIDDYYFVPMNRGMAFEVSQDN
ncbi:hypothetical protein [Vibrio tetraodonis]|uniref:hypothetical protein n=1 Tax=Vibrio tetraodonis TaxID=2231647 RepID=UPI000E0C5AC1|nr:hypothetical protein [Vibrio tetraodonis]